MRKQVTKGIAMFLGIGMLLGSFAGCKKPAKQVTPDDGGKNPVVVSEASATLRAADNYSAVYAALAKIPKETNRYYFNDWTNGGIVFDAVSKGEMSVAPTESADAGSTGTQGNKESLSYSQTNVQVEGIDEADVIKTDGSYFYILNRTKNLISIVSAEAGKMGITAEINLNGSELGSAFEMYLTENRLIVLTSEWKQGNTVKYLSGSKEEVDEYSYFNTNKNTINTLTYDVTNRVKPVLLSKLSQDGSYVSSRCVGGYVYVFTDYNNYRYYYSWGGTAAKNEDGEEQKDTADGRIPCINDKPVAPECIYICDEPNSEEFLVLTSVKISDPKQFADTKTVLSGGEHCYVSNDYIYLGNRRWQNVKYPYDRTELYRFSYENGVIEQAGQVTVKGTLNDQFSMDEYNGNLRIVTTVNEYDYSVEDVIKELDDNNDDGVVDEKDLENAYYYFWWLRPGVSTTQSNSLYIYNDKLELTGSIEKLAINEHIESARLMGNIGYFVTFRQTDPLFSVDLSDPTNPKVIGTLKIPGFSEYLHPYSENLLLGIGFDADEATGRRQGVKLSMFDVSDPANVVEVDKLVLNQFNSTFSSHKDVLVDAEQDLIGFPARGYENGKEYNVYNVYGYQPGKGFYKKFSEGYMYDWSIMAGYSYEMSNCLNNNIRGAYIGEIFYMIQPAFEVVSYDMNTWEKKERVILDKELAERIDDVEKIKEANPEPLVIRLDSNPTTGYSWYFDIVGDAIDYLDFDYEQYEADPMTTGVGGTSVFTFGVSHKGKATINFRYERAWEEEPVHTILYEVSVGDDYQIRIDRITDSYERLHK